MDNGKGTCKPDKCSEKEGFYVKMDTLDILETQESERKRIARELHDTTVQNLTSLIHKVEYCTKLVDEDPIQVKLELQTMTNVLRDTISEMREIIYNLRPMELDDLGFYSALDNFIKQYAIKNKIKFHYHKSGNEKRLKAVVGLTLFRIIKEAINNSIKHASPTEIWVNVLYKEDYLIIEIIDNGKGFIYENKSVKSNNFGLSIMKERAQLLSGSLSIDSKLEKGTRVLINIPIKNNLEENE